MAGDNVHPFRRVKWGDPEERLKVLAEDIKPQRKRSLFPLLVIAVFLATFAAVALS